MSAVPSSVPMVVEKKPESGAPARLGGFLLMLYSRRWSRGSPSSSCFVPVLGVVGAVIAWAYQSGTARLGVIDLFACEISTLCPVATVVDTVRRYAGKFDQAPTAAAHTTGPRQPPHHFSSQENYFPVFETNTRDLQTLEARVVINITEFYTYMMAFRDSAVLFEMIYSRTEVNRLSFSRCRQATRRCRHPKEAPSREAVGADLPRPSRKRIVKPGAAWRLIRSASARLACRDAKLHCFVSCGARPSLR